MKRLLIYFSVLVGCLFVGLTTYYMLKNYEFIDVTSGTSIENVIYLNVKETETLNITHDDKYEGTELSYTLSDEGIVSFDLDTGTITALTGGVTTLTINSTNPDYGPFAFDISVGDGVKATASPYYIKSVADLKAIGGTRTYGEGEGAVSRDWASDAQYQLVTNIDLKDIEWAPLCSNNMGTDSDNHPILLGFTGELLGGNYSILNMTIHEDQEYAGLFAGISSFATISSLSFESPSIIGRFDFAGTVAGLSTGATLIKIDVKHATILTAPYLIEEQKAYNITGGIVGATDCTVWADQEDSSKDNNGYVRTKVTMCSFEGTVGTEDTKSLEVRTLATQESYSTYGGIVGFGLGSIIHNTKAEVSFDINATLADLTKTTDSVKIQIGGTVGLIDKKDLEAPTEDGNIYPIIKNNLAIFGIDHVTQDTCGIIGKTPIGVQLISQLQWVFGNHYYTDNSAVTFGGSSYDNSTTKIPTIADAKKQATYTVDGLENWNIGTADSIWTIVEGDSTPAINFTAADDSIVYDNEKYEITTVEQFKKFYSRMHSTDSRTSLFWLSQHYILKCDINVADMDLTEWTPIGASETFKGVFDGEGHKIYYSKDEASELKVTTLETAGDYKYKLAGLFGVISSEAEVKNLTVEKIAIDSADYAGGIAAINNGKITDCIVNNISITNGKTSGFITGRNAGTINSSNIEYSVTSSGGFTNSIKVQTLNSNAFAGGITGFNVGTIKNANIDGSFLISGATTECNIQRYLGGAIGYNGGTIEGCSIVSAYIADLSKTSVFLGGFCGVNNGSINNSNTGIGQGSALTIIKADKTAGKQVVGGFVGQLSSLGTISQCFASVSAEAYYIGGLAGHLLGTATECYITGDIIGEYVGGLAGNLALTAGSETGGKILNCYVMASLSGASDNATVAGLAPFVRYPGIIENCFAANTFGEKGTYYYESYTDTRLGITNWFTSWVKPAQKLGTINNVVICTTPTGTINENVKKSGGLIDYNGQKVAYKNSTALSTESTLFADFGFDSLYWEIETGFYPYLANITLDELEQKTAIYIEPVDPATEVA